MNAPMSAKACPDRIGALECALKLATIAVLSSLLAACAGAGGATDIAVAGDAKGGKIVGGVREGNNRSAMSAVTAHCANYGKKAFITQMESPAQGGLLAFVCLDR